MQKYWPFVIILLLVCIFFNQTILRGFVPIPADLIVGGYFPWLDYSWGYSTITPVKNPMLSDVVSLLYPLKFQAISLIKNGEIPLWNSSMFAGYPLWGNFQIGLLFPTMLFYLFFPVHLAWTLQVMVAPLLSGIFMYLFLRHLKLEKLSGLFGAVVYAFGGFSMIWLEWNVLALTAAFLPLLLLLEDKFLEFPSVKWGSLFSISLALMLFSGYPQLLSFSMIAFVLRLFFIKITKFNVFLLAIFGGLGIGLTAVILVSGFELFGLSQRVSEQVNLAFRFLPWQNLIVFLAPDYFGNHSTGNFWGVGEYTLMTVYSGIIAFCLAFGAVLLKYIDRNIRYFCLLFLIGLIVTLPNPISGFIYQIGLWGGPASSTTRVAFLINFSIAGLAAFGIEWFKKENLKVYLKSGLYILFILIGLSAVTFLYQLLLKQAGIDDQMISNLNVALKNLIFPVSLVLTFIIIIVMGKYSKMKLDYLKIILLTVCIVELFRFGWKFNTFAPVEYLYPKTPITNFLENHKEDRIIGADVIPMNMWVPFNLESPAGYDAVYPLTWAKFLSAINTGDIGSKPSGRFGTTDKFDNKLFDLTSSKYILSLKRNERREVKENGQIEFQLQNKKFKEAFSDKSVVVMENLETLPRAFLVSEVINVHQDQVLRTMLDPEFSPQNQVVISEKTYKIFSQENNDTSKVLNYQKISNSHIRVITDTKSDQFLIVLNSFYPGWEASINDKKVPIYKTDFAFWGVVVPPGINNVDFIYAPKSIIYGIIISIVSLVILIVLNIMPPKIFKNEK